MKIHVFHIALLCSLIFCANGTLAQTSYDNWDFLIKAKNSQFTDSLATLGIRADASADFDNTYDIPRPPRAPSGNYLEVYFPHSGGNYPPLLGTRYAIDMQGPNDPIWNMSVEASTVGLVVLTWDSLYVNSIESRVHLFLHDINNGMLIDMRKVGSYSFVYNVKRDFEIIGAVGINLRYLMEGFWNGVTQVQDTVRAYLVQSISPFGLIDSTVAYLTNTGTGEIVFSYAPSDYYYLMIRHRNHLEIWCANPIAFIKGTTSFSSYDFSTSASTAFGTNALKQVGSVFATWGGDVNQDGVIDFLDRNLTWNNRGQNGYLSTDINGDDVTNSSDYVFVIDNRLKVFQRP